MSEQRELTKLADFFKTVGEPVNVSVFRDLERLFKSLDTVFIHEYGPIKEQMARVTYVGPRYVNVVVPNGSTVSLNYGSIVARGSNKEDGACNISV